MKTEGLTMIINLRWFISTLFASLAVLTAQNVFAGFPSSSGGGSYCFFGCDPTSTGGSTIVFDFNPDNDNGLAPVAINFFPYANNENLGDLCWSGKVKATIYNYISNTYPSTGTATYDILSSSGENKGMCYSNVERIEKPNSSGESYNNGLLGGLLNGRFKVDTTLATEGAYDECDVNPSAKICNIQTGFGVYNDGDDPVFIGFEALFPSEMTLSGETTVDGQVLFTDEVRVECPVEAVGINPSLAVDAKSARIYLSETLSMNAHWCTNLHSALPDCNEFNEQNERTVGSVKTAIGDYQAQHADAICVDSLDDLHNITTCPTEIAIATCTDSTTGYLTFPDSFYPTACSSGGGDAAVFIFSPAQGGGSTTVNLIAIGANTGSPGYIGDNTLPPILPGWTAIVSTPDNQPNIWDLSGVEETYQVAYIHTRNNDDEVIGTSRKDVILGGSGADTLNGNDGDDVLQGGDNADQLNGDGGNDLILGYECNSINATCGSYLNNGNDDDILIGGDGDDCMDGGRGNDTYTGGVGNDAVVIFGNSDSDTFTDYEPGDMIVDTTGSATVNWVKGSKKDDTPSICEVATSGNNMLILEGINSQSECNNVTILDVTAGATMPEQCAGHPFSYQAQ
jgi:hypothetical protein